MKRNWEALMLRAMGGRDFTLTVRGTESVGGHYQRLLLDDGGLLAASEPHPTMWIRLWFDDGGRAHQRAYTLVDRTRPPGGSPWSSPSTTAARPTGPPPRRPATPSSPPSRAVLSPCPTPLPGTSTWWATRPRCRR